MQVERLLAATVLTSVLVIGSTSQPASAVTVGVDLGTAAPPAALGGFAMADFTDNRPQFSIVTSVPSPRGGAVGFSNALEKLKVGDTWATWSHGYDGDVYFQGSDQVTLSLPGQTKAFYLYVEPNVFDAFQFVVTESGGASFTKSIVGDAGANGFGFFSADSTLASIDILADPQAAGFAVGEFGISQIPLPAGLPLMLLGLAAFGIVRRRGAAGVATAVR
jgi:hypothetical protein